MLRASDGTPVSASADITATPQQVESNNTATSSPAVHVDAVKLQNAKVDVEDHIAGYIFMCNSETKPDCFTYRVFGLPSSRIREVQKIKRDTKLFLFDFDAKLLYGLYIADTNGILALQPNAFGGKFPAQVGFSIVRACLPVPEVVFKDVIKENYVKGTKFKQELTDEQVDKLVSLFHPIEEPLPQQPSLGFCDALRSFHQKYMDPSNQVTRYTNMSNERNVPEAPQVASASRSYGQNPMPLLTTLPPYLRVSAASSSMVSSSSRVSQLVGMATQALNAEDQISNFLPSSSNEPGLSHAHMSGSLGYGYQDPVNPDSHKALSVSNRAMHAYNFHPYSESSNYQNRGDAALRQTLVSESNVPSYGYTQNQGDPALPQIQPSVSSDNSNLYYNGTNSATLAYGHGNQGYCTHHQTAVGTGVQLGSNVPQVRQPYQPTAPSGYMYQESNVPQVHQPYRPTALSGYMNQDGNIPQVHQPYWATAPSGYMNHI